MNFPRNLLKMRLSLAKEPGVSLSNLNGHSQLWDRADLDTSLAYYLNLKSNSHLNTCTSRNLLQSSLVFHSIFDIFDTENLFLSISLLILYWLKTVSIVYLVICKSAKKWYVMLISISWLCPFIKASWDKKEPGAEQAAHWDWKTFMCKIPLGSSPY